MNERGSIAPANQSVAKGTMQRLKDRFQQQKVSGQSLVVHDLRLTPQSQVLIIGFPWGAWVWNRPAAMLVEQHGHIFQSSIAPVASNWDSLAWVW